MSGAVGKALFGDMDHRVLTAYPFGGHSRGIFIDRGSIGVMTKNVEIDTSGRYKESHLPEFRYLPWFRI